MPTTRRAPRRFLKTNPTTIRPDLTLVELDVPLKRPRYDGESNREYLLTAARFATKTLETLLRDSTYRHSHKSFAVRDAMLVTEATFTDLDTFGVEYIARGTNANSPSITYLNSGDPYTLTLLRVRGRFRVGCWGDIVERGNYA